MSAFPRVRLRRIFGVINGGTPTSEPDNWDGEVPWATPADLAPANGGRLTNTNRTLTTAGVSSGSAIIPPGALLVSTRAPIGYVVEILQPTAFNQGCRGLVPTQEVDVRYFRYQLFSMSDVLNSFGQGSTFVELSSDGLASVPLFVPPAHIQRAIANYLDAETVRINALIEKKRRMIELLEEQAIVLAEQVIWDEARSTVPLMCRTDPKRPIMYGIVLPGPDVPEGVPIVKGGDVAARRLSPHVLNRTTREIEAPYARARLAPNDLVFAIRGGIGDVEIVPPELRGANITQDVARIAPAHDVLSDWLRLVLRTLTARHQVAVRVTGATVKGLNIWDLKRIRIPVSDLARQERDLAQILLAERRAQQLRMAISRQVELLTEHRRSVISAAVTGQLVIPGVAV